MLTVSNEFHVMISEIDKEMKLYQRDFNKFRLIFELFLNINRKKSYLPKDSRWTFGDIVVTAK